MTHFYKTTETPVGNLKSVASNNGLAAILWENDNLKRFSFAKLEESKTNLILLKWEKQLQEYFAGKRKSFDVDLDFVGSDFQKKVWQVLLTIPFGETRSYTQIATQIGNPKASRAVGTAIGKNPIAIIAPCHRVIGSSGELTGFSGGLEVKAFLLELENGG
jgi:methylated-DNA-[protein]-cysteine S-methyltransferase